MEIWKDIECFEGYYQVSDLGNVRSLDRLVNRPVGRHGKPDAVLKKGKVLKQNMGTTGYYCVGLHKEAKAITKMIHRLSALAFISNPDNKKEVNHINGIKTDNRVENLEWVTPKENINHATDVLKRVIGKPNYGSKNGRSKKVINIHTGEIFDCAKYAAKSISISPSYFNQMLNGSHKNITPFKYVA